MLKKSLLGAALATLLSLPAMAADVQIGVAGPLTGSNAAAGEQMKIGAIQAVEHRDEGFEEVAAAPAVLSRPARCIWKRAF